MTMTERKAETGRAAVPGDASVDRDDFLAGLFTAARSDDVVLAGSDFLARVLGDGIEVQRETQAAAARPAVRRSLLSKVLKRWHAAGGLIAAGVVGLGIGVAGGETFGEVAASLVSGTQAGSVDVMPDTDGQILALLSSEG